MSTPGSQVFLLRKSPNDPKLLVIHPDGYPMSAPPLYSVRVTSKKPNVTLSRGYMSPENIIGYATVHAFSSTNELSLRGQPMSMKQSMFGDKYSFTVPHMGNFKWKPSMFSGSHELYDGSGQKLAKLGSGGLFSSEKKLELMVPGDDFFMDLVVLTAIAAKEITKLGEKVGEAGAEVAGAVVAAT
ncbi:hypothetical protein BGZ61DRAFT_455659 [Ilyonectria robusta]|uniref:uncharacterized protein n=1 Tax=Ilyonectria robusta TaxID=1079257 RepID=UPI001E8E6E70|nr:uncharacterized protein BGZ61DRAFT_455659 [Ilyonectria robusta]KAH8684125.1 hypothetical protein BGZ61DRAFT_455659 [Ilyonectria robusta]